MSLQSALVHECFLSKDLICFRFLRYRRGCSTRFYFGKQHLSKSKFEGLLSQSGVLGSIWMHLLRDETTPHAMCPAGIFNET